jgi:type IV pilus assembly protein PilM
VIRHVVAGDIFGDGDGKCEVVVAAAPRATVEAFLEMADKAKLHVRGIDIESCAVVECFGRIFRRAGDAERTIMFVDLGATTTQIVLTHGDKLVFARNLNLGEMQIDKAIAQGMNIPLEVAHSLRWDLQKGKGGAAQDELFRHIDVQLDLLSSEITQCLRYYESVFRTRPVERAIFVGGQAYDKRMCQSLAQRLNMPAQIGDPLARVRRIEGAGLSIGLDRREPQPHWAVAVGLSLGAARAA